MSFAITKRGVQERYHYLASQMERQAYYASLYGGMPFNTDQATEEYPFLGSAPAMRKWIGSRKHKSLREFTYSLKTERYEASQGLPIDVIEDAKTTHIDELLRQLVARGMQHWDVLFHNALVAGESAACYDGQFFFDTDHAASGTNQSNDITFNVTTPASPTAEEMSLALAAAFSQIRGFHDDEGQPMNQDANAFMVIAPLAFEQALRTALGAEFVANSSGSMVSNPRVGFGGTTVAPQTSVYLDDAGWTTKFAVFRTDGLRPFIFQENSRYSRGLQVIGSGSEYEYENDAWKAGIKAKRAVGYGAWESGCLVTLT